MKKILIIAALIISFNSYAQITNDCLTKEQLIPIVTDLKKYNILFKENDILKTQIINYKKSNNLYKISLDTCRSINKDYQIVIQNNDTINTLTNKQLLAYKKSLNICADINYKLTKNNKIKNYIITGIISILLAQTIILAIK